MADKLERFGKFLLLDHLIDGGMAKICRARQLGEVADKMVAIKMVQSQYSKDAAFQKMFFDEIKVATRLIHPNIVQTYEHGLYNEQLFVAMEYCDGKNLKEYLDKLKEKKFVFPVEISVYIVTQSCQGLHYAHTLTDKLTGQSYNIVHRDISPHNIMLTFDGAVKIIDFGIAKAETNSEATQAGTIKGKLSYLAPEYLEGLQLDKRYDEFAIGITLWEMLCSRKLFKAPNDLAVLKKIQECKIPPPSSINPNVPKELDEIVLKALSKDRNKRYEDLEQLNRALIKFLYSHYPDFNASDLSYFAKELFKEEIRIDREKLFSFGKVDIKPYLDDYKKEIQSGVKGSKAQSDDNHLEQTAKRENVLDFGFKEETSSKLKLSQMAKNKDGIETDLAKGGSSTLKMDVKKKARSSHSQTSATLKHSSTMTRKVSRENATGTRSTIIQTKKTSSKKVVLGTIAVALALLLLRYPDQILGLFNQETRDPASDQNVKSEKQASVRKGKIFIKNYDKLKQKVFINGKEVSPSVIGELELPFGKVILRVQMHGHEHYVTPVTISKENPYFKIVVPETPNTEFGYLITSKSCVIGKLVFNLFGEERVEKLPLDSAIAFPVRQEHLVHYQLQGEDIQRKVNFSIDREDDTFDLCQAL